ncbi:hypothetical protein CDAR_110291 [Caerostris darwini]|uniref:Uncharacterized protein n=1 Tax=Caerostris darwini TaxID=1538125 RepID=A0AAV4UB03_9ARAC|nr:hypothetical protein CDAR_110291 [Caerostris darwini]
MRNISENRHLKLSNNIPQNAQKVKSNHSGFHQLRIRSPYTRPPVAHLDNSNHMISGIYTGNSVSTNERAARTDISSSHSYFTNTPRRWTRTTLTLISCGYNPRTPDHCFSSGQEQV